MRADLARRALLGTSSDADARGVRDAGDALVAASAPASAERHVLLAAGVRRVRERAGFVASEAGSVPEACAAEELPECAAGAARLIDELATGDGALFAFALRRLATTRRHVPARLLPAVLDAVARARSRGHLSDAAAATVVGARGAWLARLARGDWERALAGASDAARDDDERVLAEGDRDARMEVLSRRRRVTPDVVRTWLEPLLRTERADERERLVSLLAIGLAPADEGFLEGVLDDRAVGVRRAAAQLLARLPESAYARRIEERAAALLTYTPPAAPSVWQRLRGSVPRAQLDVVPPPAELPPEWLRDGLGAPVPHGTGVRAARLRELLARVPPRRWCERFGAEPAALLAALGDSEWRAAVVDGLLDALALAPDTEWTDALVSVARDDLALRRRAVAVAPAAELPRRLAAALADGLAWSDAVTIARERGLDAWDDALSAAFIASLRRAAEVPAPDDARARTVSVAVGGVADAAVALAPRALVEAETWLTSLACGGALERHRDDALARIRLCIRIHQEIRP